jgi:hypothetical protein
VALPPADVIGGINLGMASGQVMLLNTAAQYTASGCPTGNAIIDFVGYSANSGCKEGGGSAPAASITKALFRASDGCTDTDDNGADFAVASPAPRNASTQPKTCPSLAVELSLFTAASEGSGVSLAWETVSETSIAGFNIYRADAESGPWIRANATMIPSAAPGASEGHAYRWSDTEVAADATYWYLLEAVDLDGDMTRHGPVAVTVSAPNAVKLSAVSASRQSWQVMAVCGILAVVVGWWAWRRRK